MNKLFNELKDNYLVVLWLLLVALRLSHKERKRPNSFNAIPQYSLFFLNEEIKLKERDSFWKSKKSTSSFFYERRCLVHEDFSFQFKIQGLK